MSLSCTVPEIFNVN